MRYILKKDLPDVKAGAILKLTVTGEAYFVSSRSKYYTFKKEMVESNSEWFEKQQPELEIESLKRELKVTEELLADRQRLLDAIPECPSHGSCVPYALEWIEKHKIIDEIKVGTVIEYTTNKNWDMLGYTAEVVIVHLGIVKLYRKHLGYIDIKTEDFVENIKSGRYKVISIPK